MLAKHSVRTICSSISISKFTTISPLLICTYSTQRNTKHAPKKQYVKHETKKNLNNKDTSTKPKHNNPLRKKVEEISKETTNTSTNEVTNVEPKSKGEFVKGTPNSRRSGSTARWLKRQLRDPYVKQAHEEGMVSRAAYKLKEMNKQLRVIRPGHSVLDLGAAPGGWTQVASSIVREKGATGRVLSVDINDMTEIEGSTFLKLDFSKDASIKTILKTLKGKKVDVVLSDMAPSYSGQNDIDHTKLMALSNRAFDISKFILAKGGCLLVKISRGGTEKEFIEKLKKCFRQVKMVKPPASRQESSEIYASAKGFDSKSTINDPNVLQLKKEWNILE